MIYTSYTLIQCLPNHIHNILNCSLLSIYREKCKVRTTKTRSCIYTCTVTSIPPTTRTRSCIYTCTVTSIPPTTRTISCMYVHFQRIHLYCKTTSCKSWNKYKMKYIYHHRSLKISDIIIRKSDTLYFYKSEVL